MSEMLLIYAARFGIQRSSGFVIASAANDLKRKSQALFGCKKPLRILALFRHLAFLSVEYSQPLQVRRRFPLTQLNKHSGFAQRSLIGLFERGAVPCSSTGFTHSNLRGTWRPCSGYASTSTTESAFGFVLVFTCVP